MQSFYGINFVAERARKLQVGESVYFLVSDDTIRAGIFSYSLMHQIGKELHKKLDIRTVKKTDEEVLTHLVSNI